MLPAQPRTTREGATTRLAKAISSTRHPRGTAAARQRTHLGLVRVLQLSAEALGARHERLLAETARLTLIGTVGHETVRFGGSGGRVSWAPGGGGVKGKV